MKWNFLEKIIYFNFLSFLLAFFLLLLLVQINKQFKKFSLKKWDTQQKRDHFKVCKTQALFLLPFLRMHILVLKFKVNSPFNFISLISFKLYAFVNSSKKWNEILILSIFKRRLAMLHCYYIKVIFNIHFQ